MLRQFDHASRCPVPIRPLGARYVAPLWYVVDVWARRGLRSGTLWSARSAPFDLCVSFAANVLRVKPKP